MLLKGIVINKWKNMIKRCTLSTEKRCLKFLKAPQSIVATSWRQWSLDASQYEVIILHCANNPSFVLASEIPPKMS